MMDNFETKKCKYCYEEVLINAIKCKHCHSNISSITDKNGLIISVSLFAFLILVIFSFSCLINLHDENSRRFISGCEGNIKLKSIGSIGIIEPLYVALVNGKDYRRDKLTIVSEIKTNRLVIFGELINDGSVGWRDVSGYVKLIDSQGVNQGIERFDCSNIPANGVVSFKVNGGLFEGEVPKYKLECIINGGFK